jgi:hypothetical protein
VSFKKPEELWITNISRTKDVNISDLCITIKSGKSINLLGTTINGRQKYNITKEQIEKSIATGSIYTRRDVIRIRKVPPVIFNSKIDIANTTSLQSSRFFRKKTEIEIPSYPDLDVEESSQEEFAAENADLEFADRAPVLPVDPKFKINDDE